jgi:rfaE bifunctional protein kinase chain/domain
VFRGQFSSAQEDRKVDRARLRELLGIFPSKRIAIVGDFCMDVYWHADMTRSLLSRETPRFPLPVTREEFFAGGASNVAWNVAELGVGTVLAITIFGDDWRGRELSRVLAQRHGVDLRHVVTASGRVTPAFCKPIRHGFQSEQEDARLDFENATPAPCALEERIVANLTECMPTLDALLVGNQINHSLISPHVRQAILRLAAEHPDVVVLVDSRNEIGEFRGVMLKPNEIEAARVFHPDIAPADITDAVIADCGRRLSQRAGKPVFLTVGERGAFVFDGDRCDHVPGYPQRPPLDIVGAGDTFIAALGAALASGATPVEAAELACLASSVTVKKLGQTGAAGPEELLARLGESGAS